MPNVDTLQIRRAHLTVLITALLAILRALAPEDQTAAEARSDYDRLKQHLAQSPASSGLSSRYGALKSQWDSTRAHRQAVLQRRQQTQLAASPVRTFGQNLDPDSLPLVYDKRLDGCEDWLDIIRLDYRDFPLATLPEAVRCRWIGEDAILYQAAVVPDSVQILARDSTSPVRPSSRVSPENFQPTVIPDDGLSQCTDWFEKGPYEYAQFVQNLPGSSGDPFGCHWFHRDTLLVSPPPQHDGSLRILTAYGKSSVLARVDTTQSPRHCAGWTDREQPTPYGDSLATFAQATRDSLGSETEVMCVWVSEGLLVAAAVPKEPGADEGIDVWEQFETEFADLVYVVRAFANDMLVPLGDVDQIDVEHVFEAGTEQLPDIEVFGMRLGSQLIEQWLGPWMVLVHVFFLLHLRQISVPASAGTGWMGTYEDWVSRAAFALSVTVGPFAIMAKELCLDAHRDIILVFALAAVVLLQVWALRRLWTAGQ